MSHANDFVDAKSHARERWNLKKNCDFFFLSQTPLIISKEQFSYKKHLVFKTFCYFKYATFLVNGPVSFWDGYDAIRVTCMKDRIFLYFSLTFRVWEKLVLKAELKICWNILIFFTIFVYFFKFYIVCRLYIVHCLIVWEKQGWLNSYEIMFPIFRQALAVSLLQRAWLLTKRKVVKI